MAPNKPSKSLQYNFAHLALPILVLMNPGKFYKDISGRDGEDYLRTVWQDLAIKMGVRQSTQGVGLSKKVLRDNIEAFIIHLPNPIEVPDAFFAAAVFRIKKQFLGKQVESVRYFTLEMGRNVLNQSDEYHFCEWVGNVLSGGKHVNYGQTINSNVDTFVTAINKAL